MNHYVIAFADYANREVSQELVEGADEFQACQNYTTLWNIIVDCCNDDGVPLPTDLQELEDISRDIDLDIAILLLNI